MAMSLLYLVLGINDMEELKALATQYPPPTDPDAQRAIKYYKLEFDKKLKESREVREALYDALYAIAEGASVHRELSMAMGKALCSGISSVPLPADDAEMIKALRTTLQRVVREAIDEI